MIFAIVCLLAAVAVNGQDYHYPYRGYNPSHYYHDETPKPYAFNYNAALEDGQSSRAEAGDGSGKVEGSYTVTNDEGHTRVVDYIADQAGFRANIRTNEPGTDNQNPADVNIQSAGPFTPSVYHQRAYQYAPRYRRPALTAAVQPVAPADLAPENLLTPGSPALYNSLYNRNHQYRNRARYPNLRY